MKPLRMSSPVILALAAVMLPPLAVAQTRERSGEEIVKMQCSKCHGTGLHGAPHIDDRAAWAQRMKDGLDATVRSAIRGHGKMPARGGLADLSDSELRAAILYLFNPSASVTKAAAPATAAPGPNEKIVNGIDVFLGVTQKEGDLHYVNITLRDEQSRAVIDDAQVEVKMGNPVMGDETRKLARTTAGNVASYGGDFRVAGSEPHTITVQIRRPGRPGVIETKFEFKR